MAEMCEDERRYLEDRRIALARFASKNGMRPSWHEPDEQEVTAHVVGRTLDNACGEDLDSGEMVVVLRSTEGVEKVNLATLLAMATYKEREVLRAMT